MLAHDGLNQAAERYRFGVTASPALPARRDLDLLVTESFGARPAWSFAVCLLATVGIVLAAALWLFAAAIDESVRGVRAFRPLGGPSARRR